MKSLRFPSIVLAGAVGVLIFAPRPAAAQDAPPPAPRPPVYGNPPPGYAPPAPPPGYHHHDGTYVRLQLGLGYLRLGATSQGDSIEAKGLGANFDVAVGGTLAPNFILYGAFLITDAGSPSFTENGMSLGNSDGGLDVVGFGAGAAYYFPDMNLFVLGTIYAARIESSNSSGNTVGTSDLGWVVEGQVGKEWWVSADWGIGLAGQLVAGRIDDRGGSPTWNTLSFGLLFSATYN